jgi:signal transduction histidine kinase
LPQRLNHRLIFASAIFLLVVCGSALAWMFNRIYTGEKWVRHTYRVQLMVTQIETDLGQTGRVRQTFLQTGDRQYLENIQQTRNELFDRLAQLEFMVQDNADEEKASVALEQAVKDRFRTFDESLQLAQSGTSTHEAQDHFTADLVTWSQRTSTIAQGILDAESTLLDRRLLLTKSLSIWTVVVLALTFVLALYMLWEHYRGLTHELAERKLAERNALNLSAQLLNAQDQERRKIARDLHDGLGQNLVAAKMIADSLLDKPPDNVKLQELIGILQDSVASTRSISHLLHPPLVDELGFVSAARSYLDGYSSRTGIQVNADLPDYEDRLPRDLELTLFRVLQEALSNIQRHSKSTKAGVQFRIDGKTASLKIWDHGVGLPPSMFQEFRTNGTNVGVGLAGIKERVRERNGQFTIHSDSLGTTISTTFPIVSESPISSRAPANFAATD